MDEINKFEQRFLFWGMLACICFFVILFASVILLIFRTPHTETYQQINKQQLQMNKQLNTVDTSLKTISLQIQQAKSVPPEALKILTQQLNTIQSELISFDKTSDLKAIQNSIENSHQDILTKLKILQNNFQKIKHTLSPHRYLSALNLPFKVISIDVWNGEPEATINLDGNSTLMARQDTYSGWTLIDISFEPAYAIFSKKNRQIIKVTF